MSNLVKNNKLTLPSLIIHVYCQTHQGFIQFTWNLVIMGSLTFVPFRHLYRVEICVHPTFVSTRHLCLHRHCAHRHLCPPTLVPTDTCAHRHLCPPTLVPTDTCAHRHFCPPTLLPTDTFAHRHFCPPTLLPTDTFAHRHFCPPTLSPTDTFAHRHLFPQHLCPLHYFLLRSTHNTTVCLPFDCCVCSLQEDSFHFQKS